MMEPDAPFYLTDNHFKSSLQGQWFKAQAMAVVESVGFFFKRAITRGGGGTTKALGTGFVYL